MGSLRITRRRQRSTTRPPSFGQYSPFAVRGLVSRTAPSRRFRFSVLLTRWVLATRHPFADTTLTAWVRCLRLGEPPRPKQTTGVSGIPSLAQSLNGGIRRHDVRRAIARVTNSEGYTAWSSTRAHCGLGTDTLLSKKFSPPGVIDNWVDWLHVEDDPDAIDRIRNQIGTGHPCGGSRFVAQPEDLLGRLLRPAKRGRKPNQADGSGGEEPNS
jgi:hypothetical protein